MPTKKSIKRVTAGEAFREASQARGDVHALQLTAVTLAEDLIDLRKELTSLRVWVAHIEARLVPAIEERALPAPSNFGVDILRRAWQKIRGK